MHKRYLLPLAAVLLLGLAGAGYYVNTTNMNETKQSTPSKFNTYISSGDVHFLFRYPDFEHWKSTLGTYLEHEAITWKQDESIQMQYYVPPRVYWEDASSYRFRGEISQWLKNPNGIPYLNPGVALEQSSPDIFFWLPTQEKLIVFHTPASNYDQFSPREVVDSLIESFSEDGGDR